MNKTGEIETGEWIIYFERAETNPIFVNCKLPVTNKMKDKYKK